MKRFTLTIVAIILLMSLSLWAIPWLENGGWPSSGPVGSALPLHILHISPLDGELVQEAYGFCVHFEYNAGLGMDKKAQDSIRYFIDGRNITNQVNDITSLEYPTQVGEPCYKRAEPLRSGWHTVKISYEDTAGNRYDYKWRFQVVKDE